MAGRKSKHTTGFWGLLKKLIRSEIINRIRESKQFSDILKSSDFALPLRAWNASAHVLLSILLTSLLINFLSLAFPLALLQIYDRIIPNQAIYTLVILVIGVSVALLLEAAFKIARSYVGVWADAKFEHVIGCQTFDYLMNASMEGLEKEGAGIHIKRLNSLGTLRDFYSGQAVINIVDLPFVAILLALIAYIAGWLVLIPIFMLILFLITAIKGAKRLKVILDEREQDDQRRLDYIIETLGNIHTVKSIAMEAQMQRRYERLQRVNSINDYDIGIEASRSGGLGLSLSQMTLVAVVSFGSLLVLYGHLTIGGLAACTLLSGRCLQPVNVLVAFWVRLQSIRIAREDIEQIFNLPQESHLNLPDIPKLKGIIEFQNINFQFKNRPDATLHNFSFKQNPGEAISIATDNTNIKNALISLMMGFAQPESGRILYDNHDISKFNVDSFRQQIAYLPQQGRLFDGTIMENITLFREDELGDRAMAISNSLGLVRVIERLPQGFETPVGAQTMEFLPRGLIQRVTIARALLFKPAIVIFNEANTAVDREGDAAIFNVLKKIVHKCTVIIFSRHPSILKLATHQYRFTDGKLELINASNN